MEMEELHTENEAMARQLEQTSQHNGSVSPQIKVNLFSQGCRLCIACIRCS